MTMTQSLAHIPPTRTILQLIPITSSSSFHVVRLQTKISSPDRHDKRDYTGKAVHFSSCLASNYMYPSLQNFCTFPTHALYYASCPLRDNCIFRTFQLTTYAFSLENKIIWPPLDQQAICEILRPALLGLSYKKQSAFTYK
jgi:hypothetical protein